MEIRKCANCGKEIDLDDKESFKTIMHHQMHRYVCDSKCMMEFYGYKQNSNGDFNLAASPQVKQMLGGFNNEV